MSSLTVIAILIDNPCVTADLHMHICMIHDMLINLTRWNYTYIISAIWKTLILYDWSSYYKCKLIITVCLATDFYDWYLTADGSYVASIT